MFSKLISELFNYKNKVIEIKNSKLSSYSKSMEKYKKKSDSESFDLPFVQNRYDDIVKALKYTKHSKRRDELLKTKKIYDEILKEKIIK